MSKVLIVGLIVVAVGIVLFSVLQEAPKSHGELEVQQTPMPSLKVGPSGVMSDITQEFAQKYGKETDVINVTVEKEEGYFAKGLVNFTDEFSGAVWFGVKSGDSWKLVVDGQGPMKCSDAEQFSFPVDFVPVCFDEAAGTLVNR